MNKITVSAPGKLMLLGEHAVVYNRPCLVTAVGQRMYATIESLVEPVFELEATDVKVTGYKKPLAQLGEGEIFKGAMFVGIAVKNFTKKYAIRGGVRITTKSEFSSLFGFGSSSASTVCVIKGLAELTNTKLNNKEIFDLAYKTVLEIQGKGSGFDVAAAIFGGTIYFVIGGKVIEPITTESLPLVVGYSGIKADTVTMINQVAQKFADSPKKAEKILNAIAQLVNQAKQALIAKDWESLGKYMDMNQDYLRDMGVSTEKLETLIFAAKKAGAWGAKLSGAGGGDCMIAITPEDKVENVKQAINQAGGKVIDVTINVEGVRIEK